MASTWLVEETIASLPGVSEVRADDQQGTVIVQIDTERIDGQAIWEELDALGFRPVQWERHDERAAIGNQGVRL
ncbi:MAG: heavy-metal-associated domain-containing protein [Chloroflexi bacterium]|nr:heavy-metal-associated domain-containing protein [Chloroflexota bacterium]